MVLLVAAVTVSLLLEGAAQEDYKNSPGKSLSCPGIITLVVAVSVYHFPLSLPVSLSPPHDQVDDDDDDDNQAPHFGRRHRRGTSTA